MRYVILSIKRLLYCIVLYCIVLVAYTSAHPVQAVHTGLPVRSRVRTELSPERHLPGRECGITASPALCVIGRSHRAGDATYNNGRPRLRRRSTARLERSCNDAVHPIVLWVVTKWSKVNTTATTTAGGVDA